MLVALGALLAGICLGVLGSALALGRLPRRREPRTGPIALGGRDLPVYRGPARPVRLRR